MSPSRRPLQDLDAEAALLGSMLLTRDAIRQAAQAGVTAGDYVHPEHRLVHQAILSLYEQGAPIDVVTVAAELNGAGGPDARQRLMRLLADAPASANATHYARIVREHAHRRRLLHTLQEAQRALITGEDPAPHLEQLAVHDTVNTGLRISDLAAICAGDIVEERPTLLTRLDNQPLLYEARINALIGEPSVGKTWLAFAAAAETLDAGGCVLTLDWEDTGIGFVERLRTLGVDDTLIADPGRVVHVHPDLGLRDAQHIRQLVRLVETLPAPVLVIVDSYGPALARDAVDENSNSEVLQWTDRALSPLTRAGAAVLILDHVTKDPATRTRGGRGASAKLALVTGAAYEVRTLVGFARGRPGRLRLVIAKDRLGHVGPVGSSAGEVVISPHGDRVHIDVEPPPDSNEPFRPTRLMEKVSRFVEASTEPVSARTITTEVTGKAAGIRAAIKILVDEGYLTESGAAWRGRGSTYISARPFRELDASASQTRPKRVPDALPSKRVPASPPTYTSGDAGRAYELVQPSLDGSASREQSGVDDPSDPLEPGEDQ